ncbi:hypothetical protein [Embleya sp. AB8]|uniref:hypothetical protein n=1 Tax=Embleya sp. AB8 TaxID=3156304 RepID=UPI003C7830C5
MRNTSLQSLVWLARAATTRNGVSNEWHGTPLIPYPLIIGKIFELVAVDRQVGERVLALYDRDNVPAGGTLSDPRVAMIGFSVHRDPESPRLTVALACDATYRTRCSGLKGFSWTLHRTWARDERPTPV